MSDWISIDDALPERDSAVIAYIKDRDSVLITMYFDVFALARCGVKEGFTEHGVTHWVPLPSPPETDK